MLNISDVRRLYKQISSEIEFTARNMMDPLLNFYTAQYLDQRYSRISCWSSKCLRSTQPTSPTGWPKKV